MNQKTTLLVLVLASAMIAGIVGTIVSGDNSAFGIQPVASDGHGSFGGHASHNGDGGIANIAQQQQAAAQQQ